MLAQPNSIPIYFSPYNPELERIITDVTRTTSNNIEGKAQRTSAATELLASISANGYQVIVSGGSHLASKNSRIPIIQGELAATTKIMKQMESGGESNSKLPLIVIASHLNTFGLYNVRKHSVYLRIFIMKLLVFLHLGIPFKRRCCSVADTCGCI